MSRLWSFCSYSPARLDSLCGGGEHDGARKIIDAVMWDEDAWRDPDIPRRLAGRINTQGIRYTGLSAEEVECLDQMLPLLFSPEGLPDDLEVEEESPDGLHPSVVRELMAVSGTDGRSGLFAALLAGRRYGGEIAACEYCFLLIAECEQLLAEVRQALRRGGPWSQAWVPKVAEECLAGPLESAVTKRRPLFGTLS